jgi:hypothetical protein
MKTGQKVKLTNPYHAYRGMSGVITDMTTDEFGQLYFVRLADGRNVMVEASDITTTTKGK